MRNACFLVIICSLFAMAGLQSPLLPQAGAVPTRTASVRAASALQAIRSEFGFFARSTTALRAAINKLPGDSSDGDGSDGDASIVRAKRALTDCRLHYKRIEYFLEYFFHSSALIYNHPAKAEVEEPYMEFENPRGFQVMEQLLNDMKTTAAEKSASAIAALTEQAVAIDESARDLDALLYNFSLEDAPLLESLRIELIRIMTLGIEGFDAPLLKTGIIESRAALQSVVDALQPYLQTKTNGSDSAIGTDGANESDSVRFYAARSLALLSTGSDFNHFDRLGFLTRAALPLQQHLGQLITQLHLVCHTVPALNYRALNIFARDAFDQQAFPHAVRAGTSTVSNAGLVELGRRLFFETALSGNGSRSCATCHRPEYYFTDRLPKSRGFDNHSTVKRNAPSLLYAGFQYSQFWDGRAKTLEEQVVDVLANPNEMNARLPTVEIDKVAIAVAAYIRTLFPMSSAFDRYIAGKRNAMTSDQIKGFNLFMGKAQCGTCHFAPLFNGLTPPLYATTEYEVLGVPRSDDLGRTVIDEDSGRFSVYPISYYTRAFKTPTLRNTAVTGPWMHNGSFHSLTKVMDFYNKGGGKGLGLNSGLGLDAAEQTLSSQPLGLSPREIGQIKSFLRALTDAPIGSPRH